jgi:hypothetical protein
MASTASSTAEDAWVSLGGVGASTHASTAGASSPRVNVDTRTELGQATFTVPVSLSWSELFASGHPCHFSFKLLVAKSGIPTPRPQCVNGTPSRGESRRLHKDKVLAEWSLTANELLGITTATAARMDPVKDAGSIAGVDRVHRGSAANTGGRCFGAQRC